MALMRQAIRHAAEHLRCVGHAVVALPEVEGRALMAPLFAKAHEGLCPYQLFDDEDRAKAWMDDLVDKAQSPG